VQAVIRHYSAQGTLEGVTLDEKNKSGGPPVYEAKFTLRSGKRMEVHISPEGQVLQFEEKKSKTSVSVMPSSFLRIRRRARRHAAFTMMTALVAGALVLVLVAIAVPVYSSLRMRAHKQVALDKMRTLGAAMSNYARQNDGMLPLEDVDGNDTWDRIAKPEAKDVWYNALPRVAGRKGAGEYSPNEFYKDDNLVFLPGANYPDKKKLVSPQFAIAFNTKLQRNDASGARRKSAGVPAFELRHWRDKKNTAPHQNKRRS